MVRESSWRRTYDNTSLTPLRLNSPKFLRLQRSVSCISVIFKSLSSWFQRTRAAYVPFVNLWEVILAKLQVS
jgi:hypothetical protein